MMLTLFNPRVFEAFQPLHFVLVIVVTITLRDLVHVPNPQNLFQVHPTPNPVLMYANIHVL